MSSARSERQRRVWSILEGALGLPQGERPAFVRTHAKDDPRLVADVLDALARDESLGTEVSRGHADALRSVEAGLAPGTVVGERYELIEEVGRGAMGVVFRARHLDLRRDVAIKLLPPGDGYESILREGRRIAEVEHDGVVQVIDVGAHGAAPFLVMEWLAGFDLRAWLLASRSAEFGSPEERLAHFLDRRSAAAATLRDAAGSYWRFTATALRDVARAVAHAHAHGIAHQDVSPKNVVVTDAGRVSLVDFGLAAFLGGRRGEGDSPRGGTRAYAAPEHITASGGVAHDGVESLILNDVYGIGATLLHLATGLSPTELARPARGFRTVVRFGGDVASGAVVPRDLLQIAWKATSPKPAERYRSAAALADDLDRFLSYRPVTAEPPSWLHLASLWWKRDRRQVILAGLALTIVGLLGYVVEGRIARAGEVDALERAAALGERYTRLPARFGLNADPRVAFEHSFVESADALGAAGAILTVAPRMDALRLRRAWVAARAGDADLVQGDRRALESRHPGSTLLGRFFDRLESDDADVRHAGLLPAELAPCTSGLDHALAAMARSGHRGSRDAIRADAALAVDEDPRDFVSAELGVYCAMVDGDPDAWRGPEALPIADALATRSTPTVLHGRAFAVRRSDPELARALWGEMLALDPKSYYARHNLIDLDVRAKSPRVTAETIRGIDALLDERPFSVSAVNLRYVALKRLGRRAEAIRWLNERLESHRGRAPHAYVQRLEGTTTIDAWNEARYAAIERLTAGEGAPLAVPYLESDRQLGPGARASRALYEYARGDLGPEIAKGSLLVALNESTRVDAVESLAVCEALFVFLCSQSAEPQGADLALARTCGQRVREDEEARARCRSFLERLGL